MMFSLQVLLIASAVALCAGFGGGWSANGWRLGEKVSHLEGVVSTQVQSLETLKGANQSCIAGVKDVKDSVKALTDESAARSAAAAAAMMKAAKDAEAHSKAAKDAVSRPPVSAGKGCERAIAEALAYAKKRKEASQ